MSSGEQSFTASLRKEREEPVLEFSWFKDWPYQKRMRWTVGLAAVGLMLQVLFLSPWPGVPFLVAALVLSWVVGLDTGLDRRALHLDRKWELVPYPKVREIIELDRKMRSWDFSALDISSGGGAALFLLGGGAITIFSVILAGAGHLNLGLILFVDGLLLVLPQFFSGMRRIHRQPDLLVKAQATEAAMRRVRSRLERRGEVLGQLLMSGPEEGRKPTDLRLSVRYPGAPSGFHGVQCQVVLNRVQGKPHPYFYSVVVAEVGLGLLDVARQASIPMGLVLETKTEKGVDVAVIRQYTTKTSGYHTKPAMAAATAETAGRIAEAFLDAQD